MHVLLQLAYNPKQYYFVNVFNSIVLNPIYIIINHKIITTSLGYIHTYIKQKLIYLIGSHNKPDTFGCLLYLRWRGHTYRWRIGDRNIGGDWGICDWGIGDRGISYDGEEEREEGKCGGDAWDIDAGSHFCGTKQTWLCLLFLYRWCVCF